MFWDDAAPESRVCERDVVPSDCCGGPSGREFAPVLIVGFGVLSSRTVEDPKGVFVNDYRVSDQLNANELNSLTLASSPKPCLLPSIGDLEFDTAYGRVSIL